MTVRFNNYAKVIGHQDEAKYYEWRVFVDEPPEVLDQIEEVEYLLHRSFPEPFERRSDQEENFALEKGGWGEFMVLIRVKYKDHQKPDEDLKYWLVLDPDQKPWLEPAAPQ